MLGPRRQKLQCTMLGLGMGELLQTGPGRDEAVTYNWVWKITTRMEKATPTATP